MTALKKSLDRALSGVEFRPELKRRVLMATSAAQGFPEAVRPKASEAAQTFPKAVKPKATKAAQRLPKSGMTEAPETRCRLSTTLVFALVAALILMAVAVAVVVTRGFGWHAKQIDVPALQYSLNELEKRATVVAAQQAVSGQDGQGAARFEVTQAYYDGSRIDVAYTLSAPDYCSDASWRPTASELMEMPFYEGGGELAFEDPASNLQMALDFKEKGECGLHVHSYLIGENLLVNGEKCRGWDTYDKEWQDGLTGGYQILEDLPRKACNRDNVSLTFSLAEYDLYYCRIPEGYYYRIVRGDEQMLEPVVVPRGKGETVTAKASEAFDTYRVYVRAAVSPVEVEALICQILPDDWVLADPWTRGLDLAGVDYIKDYHLYANEAALETFLSAEGNGTGRLEGELPKAFREAGPKKLYTLEIKAQGVPEGTKEIRLRPVYSISGEHPEEDLVLEIPG